MITGYNEFFATLLITLEFPTLFNYFDGPTKLFSDLYLAKFLDISAEPFFSYNKLARCNFTLSRKDIARNLISSIGTSSTRHCKKSFCHEKKKDGNHSQSDEKSYSIGCDTSPCELLYSTARHPLYVNVGTRVGG